jgi:hypothetical protein
MTYVESNRRLVLQRDATVRPSTAAASVGMANRSRAAKFPSAGGRPLGGMLVVVRFTAKM